MGIDSSWWTGGGKRTFDLVASVCVSLVALPVMLVCAALVRALDGSPVLFRQTRVGRHGRLFQVLKLRTMRLSPGSLVTSAEDPRITRLGRWLRHSKLDELPQLWNVLRGEMSLVGPRPEVPPHVAAEPRSFRAITDLRPGITDWASVVFHDEEIVLRAHAVDPGFYEQCLLPRKLALARLYHIRMSVRTDLAIMAATVCASVGAAALVRAIFGPDFVARARGQL